MASENVLEISDANFEDEVINSDVPVLLDFWAEWCMPCRMLGPIVEELADEYAGKVKVGKLDTDANRDTATKFNITAIPSVLVFAGGQVIKQLVGLQSKRDLKAVLDEALG